MKFFYFPDLSSHKFIIHKSILFSSFFVNRIKTKILELLRKNMQNTKVWKKFLKKNHRKNKNQKPFQNHSQNFLTFFFLNFLCFFSSLSIIFPKISSKKTFSKLFQIFFSTKKNLKIKKIKQKFEKSKKKNSKKIRKAEKNS